MPTSSKTPIPPTTPPKPTWDPKPVNVRPFPWLRPTIRIRLTLLYGGMFLMAGIVLLTIIYMLAANALQEGSELPVKILRGNFAATSNVCNLPNESSGEIFTQAIQSCLQHQRAQALNTLLNRSLLALLGLTVVAFAFGYAMAGRVLSPLGRITRTAQRVAGSDLHRRIELGGPDDELKELADTFDEMLDRLDRAFESQRRFVANASHELRTPLAINRTLLEVQLADPDASPELAQLGKTLLATNERSEQLVEGLLLLARSENKIVDKKPVDLAEVASQALRSPPSRSRAVPCWSSPIPVRRSRRTRWRTSSSRSAASVPSAPAATRASAWACPSCGPWCAPTTAPSRRRPAKAAAWRCASSCPCEGGWGSRRDGGVPWAGVSVLTRDPVSWHPWSPSAQRLPRLDGTVGGHGSFAEFALR